MPVSRESELVKRRGTVKAKLTAFTKHVQGLATARQPCLGQLKVRVEQIGRDYETFEQIQEELESLATGELIEVRSQERTEFEDAYFTALGQARDIIDSAPTPSTSQIMPTNALSNIAHNSLHVKLPTMSLPTFSGAFESWPSFRDAFKSAIHENPNISDAQKLIYLRSCLSGQAADRIESLETTAENFAVAWDILNSHYNNIRTVVSNRVKAIFELPECAKETAESLGALVDKAEKHYNALKALKKPLDHVFPVYAITSKLSATTRILWSQVTRDTELPTTEELLKFLHDRRRDLETAAPMGSDEAKKPREPAQRNTQKQANDSRAKPRVVAGPTKAVAYATQTRPRCELCKESHFTQSCERLVKASVSERADIVKTAGLCYNCLRSNHASNQCTAGTCKKCNGKHHTLLHREKGETSEPPTPKTVSLSVISPGQIVLPTAIINIFDYEGKAHACRALLDSAAQSNFITEKLADKLGVRREPIHIPLTGIAALESSVNSSIATTIQSRMNKYKADLTFLLLPKITELIPSSRFALKEAQIPKNIRLADPKFNVPAEIDVLIGAQLFMELLCAAQITPPGCGITFQKTKLGWVASGGTFNKQVRRTNCNVITTDLREQMEKFWAIEELPIAKNLSVEETQCEQHYQEHTRRDASGRYIVKLPFRDNVSQLSESYSVAVKRFRSLERSLARKEDVKQQYIDFMKEYVALGHMSEVTAPNSEDGYYLPHHAVLKQTSLTTKLRVIFDGSAKSSSGLSLNNVLMVGPTIQDDLVSLLIRFRSHAYVLKADIAKMYRQVLVEPSDRVYQKILWREDTRQPIKTYEMNTVTYGTSPASFLATRTLHQLASDEATVCPNASVILKEDFYVDDLLTGAATLSEAKLIRDELTLATSKAGLQLRQWASNHDELIADIAERDNTEHIRLDLDHNVKTLGIDWNAKNDTINYSVNKTQSTDRVTKRIMLSEIAKLFDSLGLLGPVIIRAKLMMQRLWLLDSSWDESVPLEVHTAWQTFRSELPSIEQVSFDRRIVSNQDADVELHGFCDASERAYGACIYLKTPSQSESTTVQLVCAKSRVAPLKTQTLPRLELCAALLLAQLYRTTVTALRRTRLSRTYFWSDSTITLHWINTPPHTLKTFVSHRVAEIQQITRPDDWRHVASESNPADLISRGMSPSDFIESTLWRTGPTWLREPEDRWPLTELAQIDVPERRPAICLTVSVEPWSLIRKYSSLRTLIHVVAYCQRFAYNTRNKEKRIGTLTTDELRESMTTIIKITQREAFSSEIDTITAGKNLVTSLASLSPFVDKEGVLRVGGRLSRSGLPYEQKHPALLPKSHSITDLIIRENHLTSLHGGAQATLSRIRESFWPINGKVAVRRVLGRCVTCRRAKPSTVEHKMGDLPASRLVLVRPFLKTGVDYCGPFFIKEKRHRNRNRVKVYVAIFVCFAVKAVHIEVVSDLTTEAFLAALKRFVSRRGKCTDIYSDNATNFVGADNELKSLVNSNTHNDKVASDLADEGIRWHFIPPRSPHFGGLWEASYSLHFR